MLSSLSYKVIDVVFSGVSVPAIIILSITMSIFTFNAYIKSLSFFKIFPCRL